jgi:hypothetical protein
MRFASICASTLFLLISAPCWAQGTTHGSSSSPRQVGDSPAVADLAVDLRKMHEHMISASQLDFTTEVTVFDRTLGTTSKGSVHFILRKPNLLRVTAVLGEEKLNIVSDGTVLTIHKPNDHSYRQYDARKTIIANLDLAAGLQVVQARMVEFFMNMDYLKSTDGTVRIHKLPDRKIANKTCAGFNIVYDDYDWQIWLEQSGYRLPCRLVSKRLGGYDSLTQTNIFSWKAKSNHTLDDFKFVPLKGDKKE